MEERRELDDELYVRLVMRGAFDPEFKPLLEASDLDAMAEVVRGEIAREKREGSGGHEVEGRT